MSGVRFLVEARELYPEAGRVLLTTYADTEAAILSINEVGINHYLVKPGTPPEENLYPILDELLEDWLATVRLPYMQVRTIMTTQAVRIRHSASLRHAAEIVALSGVGDLMVVDEGGNFVGVLSEGDILRNALPDFEEILEEGGTLYDAFQLFMRKGRELSDKPITPLVIREPLTVHPDDHVAKAATVLINRQIRRLPVVEEGRLVGTVSRANICQAVVGTL
jgi:CBS domain-containing protein